MYKDFKKNESLDTGFVGGNGIIWMFSGVTLGLLVGLGMYYFANNVHTPALSSVDSVQKKIVSAQAARPEPLEPDYSSKVSYAVPDAVSMQKEAVNSEPTRNKFSYYAVLPTLDVPVASIKPIETKVNTLKNDAATAQKVALLNGADIQKVNQQAHEPVGEQVEVAHDGGFLLQVASFRRLDKANLTIRKLKSQGVTAYVQEKQIKGRLWYRVVAGPLDHDGIDNWKHQAERLGHRPLVISLR